MSHAHQSHKKQYLVIFAVLAILTAVELCVPAFVHHGFGKASALTGLAFGKAFLVAYFFMHLNEETRWLKFIAAIPLSSILYATMVIIESLVR